MPGEICVQSGASISVIRCRAARAGDRTRDGALVTFWRLLLHYPELIAWEKLWTDGQHSLYAEIAATAKRARPQVEVGFHLWRMSNYSPFCRAEEDHAQFARYADFLKVVAYNNCGGERYASYISNVALTVPTSPAVGV